MLVALILAGQVFGHDHYVSRNSAWCWFTDPWAIRVGDRILAGGVTQAGDIVANEYDPATKSGKTHVLATESPKADLIEWDNVIDAGDRNRNFPRRGCMDRSI